MKWEWANLIHMTTISTTVGKDPQKKWSSPQSTKESKAVLGYNLKNNRMTYVNFQGKLFNITVIQVYIPTTNAKEAEIKWFCEDLQDLLELTPKKKKKKCPFHHRRLEYESRKSRYT